MTQPEAHPEHRGEDAGMSYPFDWNEVEPAMLEALTEAVDESRPAESVPMWPMVTNEFGMDVLAFLWDRGFCVVPVPS